MNKAKNELKSPESFVIKLPLAVAKQFREHCRREGLIMGVVLERAIVAYLVKEGIVLEELER